MSSLPDFVLRMQAEQAELANKTAKLSAFLERPDAADILSEEQGALMRRQLLHMEGYLGVLSARLELALPTS